MVYMCNASIKAIKSKWFFNLFMFIKSINVILMYEFVLQCFINSMFHRYRASIELNNTLENRPDAHEQILV